MNLRSISLRQLRLFTGLVGLAFLVGCPGPQTLGLDLTSSPQAPKVGEQVTFEATLTGTAAEEATIAWEVKSRPQGSTAAISGDGNKGLLLPDVVGTYVVQAIATAGEKGEVTATREASVSASTDPAAAADTAITVAPPALSNEPAPSFEFTATRPGSTFHCSLDGADWASCDTPHTVSALLEGAHRFEVRAIDPAGNVDITPAVHEWFVDLTAPETSIVNGPAATSGATTASFFFVANEARAQFFCILDDGAEEACTSPMVYTALARAPHTFSVVAVDEAGNRDDAAATHSWTIDHSALETVLTNGPPSPTNSTAATFYFVGASADVSFRCALDGSAAQPCQSPMTYSALTDGPHDFSVAAVDGSGTSDPTPATFTWVVDTLAAETTFTAKPQAFTSAASASFQFTSSETGGFFNCQLDQGTLTRCTSPHALNGLGEGEHSLLVVAVDAAGNADPSPAVHTWTVDQTAPTTTIESGPPALFASSSAAFSFKANEQVSFSCSLDAAPPSSCASPFTLSSLSDGAHTLAITSVDLAGNAQAAAVTHSWTVDTTAPNTVAGTLPPARVNTAQVSLTFSSNDPVATFRCALDGEPAAACTSPHVLSALGEGMHSVVITAVDAVGNADPTPLQHAFTVDTLAPETFLTNAPANPTFSTSAQFTFSTNETGATFECSLDGSAYAACTSPHSRSALAVGSHTFSVRGRDVTGNVDASPATHTWTIQPAPQVDTALTNGPADPSSSPIAAFYFSGANHVSFQCALDGAAPAPCTSPVTFTNLADGNHTFVVAAVDAQGTVDSTPASLTWKIDTVPPNTALASAPVHPSKQSAPSFTFTTSETGGYFNCRIDAGGWTTCTSPWSPGTLTDGSHTVVIIAVDAAGNSDPSPVEFTWTVDTVAPATTLSSAPAALINQPTASFVFESSEAGTFQCSIDGAAFTACTSPVNLTGLSDGSHSFQVFARDLALNDDASPSSHTFTVDATAPDTAIASSGPAAYTSATSATLSFSSPDASATFRCALDGAAAAPCTSPVSLTSLADGAHTLVVTAVDPAGNLDPSPAQRAWTVDTVAPATTIDTAPSDPNGQTTPTFAFSCDEASCAFECKVDAAAFSACASPFTTAALADGAHTFEVRAIDPAANADATAATHAWTVDTVAPNTTIISAPTGVSTETSPTVTFTSSDSTATFQCSLDGAVFVTCTSPHSLSVTDGAHTFAVRGLDAAGNADATPASATWTTDVTPPQITFSTSPANPTNQTSATFTFSADESTTFTCKLDNGTAATCTSPHTVSSLAHANHTFTVQASDAAGNVGSAVHTWMVDLIVPSTSVSGPSAYNVTNPTFSLYGSDVNTYECALDGGAFAPCTSPYQLTALAEGSHTLEVRAIDAAGNVDATPYVRTWTVDTVAPGAVTGFAATAGDRRAEVTFTPVTDAYRYRVSYDDDDGQAPFDGLAYVYGTPYTVSFGSPVNCVQMNLAIQAEDSAGNLGPLSPVIQVTPKPAAPNLNSNSSNGVMTFSYSIPYAGYAPSSYKLQYGSTAGGPYNGTRLGIGNSPVTLTTTSVTEREASPTSTYYVVVTAFDGTCEGAPSAETAITPHPWRYLNPLPTGNDLLAVSCASGADCVALGDRGTAIRTTNGTNWSLANGADSDPYRAVTRAGPGLLFAVSGTQVNKSTNGGLSWYTTGNVPGNQDLLGVSFATATTGYAVGINGAVVKTSDAGATWVAQSTGTTAPFNSVYAHPNTNNAVMVGQSGFVRTTLDGGATWTTRTSGTTLELTSVTCASSSLCWAVGWGGVIVASTNGGVSWSTQTSGVTSQLNAVAFANTTTGWTVGNAGTILKTTNGGATWVSQTSGESGAFTAITAVSASQAWAVGRGGVIRATTDGGATWTAQHRSLTTALLNRVVPTSAGSFVAVGENGTMVVGSSGGAMLTVSNPVTTHLQSVYFPTATTGYAVGASGRVLKTTNGGATWAAQTSPTTGTINDIHCFDANTCVAGVGTQLLKTSNGGTGWTLENTTVPSTITEVFFLDTLNGYLGTLTSGGVNAYRTTDSGLFWSASPIYYQYYAVRKIVGRSSSELYAITHNNPGSGGGYLNRSTNGGVSWSYITYNGPVDVALTSTAAVTVGDNGTATVIQSNGSTQYQNLPAAVSLRSIAVESDLVWYVVGANGSMFVTTTAGR